MKVIVDTEKEAIELLLLQKKGFYKLQEPSQGTISRVRWVNDSTLTIPLVYEWQDGHNGGVEPLITKTDFCYPGAKEKFIVEDGTD